MCSFLKYRTPAVCQVATSIKVYLQKHEYGKRKDVFFKGLKIKIIT